MSAYSEGRRTFFLLHDEKFGPLFKDHSDRPVLKLEQICFALFFQSIFLTDDFKLLLKNTYYFLFPDDATTLVGILGPGSCGGPLPGGGGARARGQEEQGEGKVIEKN